jgi:hypothetical protein
MPTQKATRDFPALISVAEEMSICLAMIETNLKFTPASVVCYLKLRHIMTCGFVMIYLA